MLKAIVAALVVGSLMTTVLTAQNELAKAIERRDVQLLEQVLEKNPELINQPLGDNFGDRLPLVLCIKLNNLQFAEKLIDAGASVDALGQNNFSPLMIAAWDGNLEFVSYLLERGADVNLADPNNIHGQTAIVFASKIGDLPTIKLLLKNGADVTHSHAFAHAMYGNHISAAHLLLDHGSDPNFQDSMFIAAERAPLELLERMIELGGDVNAQHYYGNVLARAAASLEKTELLIRHGADVNASLQNGDRALHRAAFFGNVEVARLLIGNGALIDIEKANGQRPVDVVVWRVHAAMVRFLVENGARPTIHSLIAMEQNEKIQAWLSEKPDDIEIPIPDSSLTRPIHTATKFRNTDALRILLAAGADPNALVQDESALHMAARIGYIEATQLLLDNDAKVNATLMPNRYGMGLKTPLHFAIERIFGSEIKPHNMELVELLLERGADASAADELGKTPLGLARDLANEPMLDLFRKFEN